MRWIFIFLAFILVLSPTAQAQDFLNTPNNSLIDEQPPEDITPKTKKDFSDLYYQQCQRQYFTPGFEEHTKLLCACTAATMHEALTVNEARAFFTNTKEGKFQRDRLALHGFIPCLREPLSNLTFDRCYMAMTKNADTMSKQQKQQEYKSCKCLGQNMAEYAKDNAFLLIDKSMNRNFSANKIPQDVLMHILDNPYYLTESRRQKRSCNIQTTNIDVPRNTVRSYDLGNNLSYSASTSGNTGRSNSHRRSGRRR